MNINFSGEPLSEEERNILGYSLSEHRISKHLKDVKINVKEYKKEGFRRKIVFSVLAKTDYGEFSTEVYSWYFNKAVKNLLNKTEKFLLKNEEKEKVKRVFSPKAYFRKLQRKK